MDVSWMREHVKKCPKYDTESWHVKVDGMSEKQIIAIYKSFLQKGLFRPLKEAKKDIFGEPIVKFTQPTLFDIYPEAMGRKVR